MLAAGSAFPTSKLKDGSVAGDEARKESVSSVPRVGNIRSTLHITRHERRYAMVQKPNSKKDRSIDDPSRQLVQVEPTREEFDHQTFAAVPPPLIFLGALVVGVALNIARPLAILPNGRIGDVLGLAAALGSAAIAFWAFRTMVRAGEHPDPSVRTRKIVEEGPFSRTRNPIYLSFALFDLGVALLMNNLWILLALVPLMLYVDRGIVRREERSLEQQFGDEYLDYKQSVRRWI